MLNQIRKGQVRLKITRLKPDIEMKTSMEIFVFVFSSDIYLQEFWKCHKQEIHTVHRFMLVSYYCTKLSWVEITIVIPLCFNKVILRILLGLRLIFGLLINCKISMIVKIMTLLFRIPPGFISVCYFCFSYRFLLWLFKKIFSMKSSQKRQFLAHEYC